MEITNDKEFLDVAEVPVKKTRKKQKPINEEPVAAPEEPKNDIKIGVVTECVLLKVRSSAEVKSDNILAEIKLATEVEVDLSKSTDEFYKVYVPSEKFDGYCMKKFVNIGE